ncbi:MAG: fatty acid desaturase [Pseudomonadota bacterium]
MSELSIAAYAREIRPALRSDAFTPARSRLWWLPLHLAVISVGTVVLAKHWVSWAFAPLLSILLGASFAGLTFLGHETLHGAVVRGKLLRKLVGWFGFLAFVISPRLWVAWHNRVHHGHTNRADIDPDAYPTLAAYDQSRAVRFATSLSPGLRRVRGVFSLLFGFSIQSTHMLLVARHRGYLSPREHALAIAETALGICVWGGVAYVVGPLAFLFAYALPLLVANLCVMSFILTNHSLSPLTSVNDPLANSLSVTLPAWLEWPTLGFGYHVEHHLFPAMSARSARSVRDVLRARWPARYQSMPLHAALLALHRSPRVYKDPKTLVDPGSFKEWPALGRRASIAPKSA